MDKESITKTDLQSRTLNGKSCQFSQFENELIHAAWDHVFTQSEYQCNYFVSQSHPTFYRQVRQTLLELATRKHSLEKIKINLRKVTVEIAIKEKEIAEETDENKRELLIIQRDDFLLDKGVYLRKERQCNMELKYFTDWLQRHGINEDNAEEYFKEDQQQERAYWIARLAKQSSLDLMTTGRLGSGNLDSILNMEEEDQVEVLGLSLRYAGAINASVEHMKLESEKEIRFSPEALPDTSFLEEQIHNATPKNLQPADKSETGF